MDFSEAECSGFTCGFITFWTSQRDNAQNWQELQVAAECLLKGCCEHYHAGVTHVSHISGAVPAGIPDAFKKCALALLNFPSSEEFVSQAVLLVQDFPSFGSWMECGHTQFMHPCSLN